MKTKLTLFVAVLAVALFGMGCASSSLNKGLLVYYPFNGNAKDKSGNGYDAQAKNFPSPTSDRHGNPENAYKFNGIDDYVVVPDEMFTALEAVTISCWVNLDDSTDNWSYIFSGHKEGNDNLLFIGFYGELKRLNICHKQEILAFPMIGYVGKWKHLVVARADLESGFNVYLDGKWKALIKHERNYALEFASGGVLIGPDQDEVGGGFGEHEWLKGSLDDYRIYNRALSAEEVKALYDLEKPEEK